MLSFIRFYDSHHRQSSMPIPNKKWQSPPPGYFKLNVDGALSLSSGLRGVGVVVRDSYGHLCGAVGMRAHSLPTVLYTLKIGNSFAVDASLTPLIIEFDSSISIHLILQEDPCYAAEGALLKDIRGLLALPPPTQPALFPAQLTEWRIVLRASVLVKRP
ncbi:uncharacterized protein LOC110772866 [Prunus avium]|uniref:Uncharacterized protein LOC110772866 n=1 Tax=Prunus avium TaxID=42229 RepID=A0A6P5U1J0_PRUAV|nr:uncharacterized protein LOC110772866 [Prunus avium]